MELSDRASRLQSRLILTSLPKHCSKQWPYFGPNARPLLSSVKSSKSLKVVIKIYLPEALQMMSKGSRIFMIYINRPQEAPSQYENHQRWKREESQIRECLNNP